MKYNLFKVLGLALLALASTGLPANALSYTSDLFPNGTIDAGWSLDKGSTRLVDWKSITEFTGKKGDLTTAENATGAAFCQYEQSQKYAMDAWLISPSLHLVGGVTYTVGIYARTNSNAGAESFKVLWATEGTMSAMRAQNNVLISQTDYKNWQSGNYEHFTAEFTPSADGDFYFGINGCSKADQDNLFVTHFTVNGEDGQSDVDEPVVVTLPFAINTQDAFNLCKNTLADGTTPGNWEFNTYYNYPRIWKYNTYEYDDYLTTPAMALEQGKVYSVTMRPSYGYSTNNYPGYLGILLGKSGDALKDFTLLEEYTDLVYEETNKPQPVRTVYFAVEEDGEYCISFHSTTMISIYDIVIEEGGSPITPAAVSDLTVAARGTTNVVDVTFTVPTTNLVGTPFDAGTQLVVKVTRGETEVYNRTHTIGETVSFTDTDVPDGDAVYTAVVYNGDEASVAATAACWVGELKTILADSFAGAKVDTDIWTIESSSSYAWEPVASNTSSPYASPQDNDGGMLFFNAYNAQRNETSTLTSKSISTASSTYPKLSFWLYGCGSGAKVQVLLSKDGGAWQILDGCDITLSNISSGWTEISVPIKTAIAGSNTYQVAFKAISDFGSYRVLLDNIVIENDPSEYFKVMNLAVTPVEGGYSLDWTAPETDEAVTYDIVRYVNGKESETFTDVKDKPFVDMYEPDGIVTIYYTVTGKTASATTAPATSAEFKAGSIKLPFADSFANKTIRDEWTIECAGSTYKWQTASEASRPSGSPQDNDGGLLYYNVYNATRNATTTLVTPPLHTSTSTNPELSFWILGPSGGTSKLEVMVSTDGGEWKVLDGGEISISTLPSGWNEMTFPLINEIAGSISYQIAFKATSDYGSFNINIDNIAIENKAENDLVISSISGPAAVMAGKDAEYTFTVTNKGAYDVTADDYAVVVECESIAVAPVESQAIQAGRSAEFTFTVPFTVDHVSEAAYMFNVNVAFEADEVPDNNSASIETVVGVSDKKGVETVTATLSDDGSTITVAWEPVLDMTGYEPVDIHESFETVEPETTGNINGFTVLDLSSDIGSSWYGVNDTPFKVIERPITSFTSGPKPSDGDKYIIAIGKNMDDWLISPELNCFPSSALSYSFDAYFKPENGNKFEVLYSTTDAEPESFVNVIDSKSLTLAQCGEWVTYSYTDIPAEAKYIALHINSQGGDSTTGVFIDNIKISDAIEPVVGYHVYEEGVGRLNGEILENTVTSYQLPAMVEEEIAPATVEFLTRSFTVTAVYEEGETMKSAVASVEIQLGEEDPIRPDVPDQDGGAELVAKNVYAYDINVTPYENDLTKVVLQYRLNGKTKSVSIQPMVDGQPVGSPKPGTTEHNNTVDILLEGGTYDGELTFAITAVPEVTVETPTLVKDEGTPDRNGFYSFWSPTTIAVNNCTDSPTFGRVLTVENRYHATPFGTSKYHAYQRGAAVYAFDPQMVPVKAEDGKPGFTLGLGFNNDTKNQIYGDYQDLRYTADGRLFLATADTKKYGIYEIDPDDMDATAQPLFEAATDHNVWAFDMYETGNGYKVVAVNSLDANKGQADGVTTGRIMIYNLDENGNISEGTRVLDKYSFPNGLGTKVRIDPDGQGFYVSSHRGANTETEPHLMHADMNGENVDNDYTTVINAGAMAYNKDNTLFARAEGNATVAVYEVTAVNNGLKPTMKKLFTFNAGIGNPVMAVAFDYANNLFVSGNNAEKFQQFQLPASYVGESTTVMSPKSQAILLNHVTTGVDNVAVEGSEADAVYYNLNGVRVAGNLVPGVYVKVVGKTATKVVVK